MNFFCRLFGHTWSPAISAPEPRWNTTKDMQILASSSADEKVRHFDRCVRCGEERDLPGRALDSDKPHREVLMDPKDGSAVGEDAEVEGEKTEAESA